MKPQTFFLAGEWHLALVQWLKVSLYEIKSIYILDVSLYDIKGAEVAVVEVPYRDNCHKPKELSCPEL